MSWHAAPLGEIADVQLGKMLDQKKNQGEYRRYLGNDNVQWNQFKLDEIKEMRIRDAERERFGLRPGDLLICEGGDPGRCALWTSDEEMYYQKALNRVRACDDIDPRYLLYYFLHIGTTREVAQYYTGGATIKHLPNTALKRVEVRYPDLETQRRIASILMAYDNLIENNRRQIALLEEAAQRLYREWFVDLRFPGHEGVEIVDEWPSTWQKSELGKLVKQIGKPTKKSERDRFKHYLPIDSIPAKAITCWDSDLIEHASSSLVAFDRNDFLFGAMRPYFHKVIIAPYIGLTRSTCLVLGPVDATYWAYAYMTLFAGNCVQYATAISVGTTMPYVRWEDFKLMPIIIPDRKTASSFNDRFEPLRYRIETLHLQNSNAREARDRLLPKLMSGEIEV